MHSTATPSGGPCPLLIQVALRFLTASPLRLCNPFIRAGLSHGLRGAADPAQPGGGPVLPHLGGHHAGVPGLRLPPGAEGAARPGEAQSSARGCWSEGLSGRHRGQEHDERKQGPRWSGSSARLMRLVLCPLRPLEVVECLRGTDAMSRRRLASYPAVCRRSYVSAREINPVGVHAPAFL